MATAFYRAIWNVQGLNGLIGPGGAVELEDEDVARLAALGSIDPKPIEALPIVPQSDDTSGGETTSGQSESGAGDAGASTGDAGAGAATAEKAKAKAKAKTATA